MGRSSVSTAGVDVPLRRHLTILVALVCVTATPTLGEAPEDGPDPACAEHRASSLTVFLENDLFIGFDSEYTSGVGVSWGSGNAETYGPRHLITKLDKMLSFLPRIDDKDFTTLFTFTLGQEMYTPKDISSPIPPPDDQPYAGILFLDSAAFAHSEDFMHEYSLRIGCVGPCSGAEQSQRRIHEWIDAPIPQGWEYQLDNELLLNAGYQYHRNLVRKRPKRSLGYDSSISLGGALGNYYTGANASLVARAGFGLPSSYGNATLRTGGSSQFVGAAPDPGEGWRVFAYLGVNGFAVARFLPTDGNTFEDSPSVDRNTLTGMISGGFVIGYRNFKATWAMNHMAGFNDDQDSRANDFGSVTVTIFFQR